MHPNHLCVEPRSNTSIACPFWRSTSLGLCDWVVNTFVFRTFSCSLTSAKHVTSSSNKNVVSSNVLAKRRISSANLKSKSVRMPSWNPRQHCQPSDASIQGPLPEHTRTTADSIHILVARLPWYKMDLHQYCCLQFAPFGHHKCIAKPTTYDRTLHVRWELAINFPIWPYQMPSTNPSSQSTLAHQVQGFCRARGLL